MLFAFESHRPRRGDALLLAHCEAERPEPDEAALEHREPVAERLERQLGSSLTGFLVRALGRR